MFQARFRNRAEAGRLLGARLLQLQVDEPIVLALPRGGVVVAAEVAAVLGAQVDVFVARKIGHPARPELGLGAIAEGGDPAYDEPALRHYGLKPEDLAPVVAAERDELARRVAAYRGNRVLPPLASRSVVVVDDGIATGATARAALQALREQRPGRLVFAAPIGPAGADEELPEADDVIIMRTPRHFLAVGQWYDEFGQVTDEEVLRLLASRPDPRSR